MFDECVKLGFMKMGGTTVHSRRPVVGLRNFFIFRRMGYVILYLESGNGDYAGR